MSESAGVFYKLICIHRWKCLHRYLDRMTLQWPGSGLGQYQGQTITCPFFIFVILFLFSASPRAAFSQVVKRNWVLLQCVGVYCDFVCGRVFSLLSYVLYGMFINKKLSNQDQDVIPLFPDRVTLFVFLRYWYWLLCFNIITRLPSKLNSSM